jgi:hypothetical protein
MFSGAFMVFPITSCAAQILAVIFSRKIAGPGATLIRVKELLK